MSNPGRYHRNKVCDRCRAWLDAWGIQSANAVANWPTRLHSWDSALFVASPDPQYPADLSSHCDRCSGTYFPTLVAVWRFGLRLELVAIVRYDVSAISVSPGAPRLPVVCPRFACLPVRCACRWASRDCSARFNLFYRSISSGLIRGSVQYNQNVPPRAGAIQSGRGLPRVSYWLTKPNAVTSHATQTGRHL